EGAELLHVLGQDRFVTEVTRHLGEAGQEFVHRHRRTPGSSVLLKIPRQANLDHRSLSITCSVTEYLPAVHGGQLRHRPQGCASVPLSCWPGDKSGHRAVRSHAAAVSLAPHLRGGPSWSGPG